MSVKVEGLREWQETLHEAIELVPEETAKVVGRGCLNVKREWQSRWKGHPHISHLPYTINYDVETTREDVSGQVGPDLNRGGQAPLGGVIEYGSPTSAPIPGGLPALELEAPRFEKALADMAEKLLAERRG